MAEVHTRTSPLPKINYTSAFIRLLLEPYTHHITSFDIMFSNTVEAEMILHCLTALQELQVNMKESLSTRKYTILQTIPPSISQLFALRTFEFKGISAFSFDSLPVLTTVWARLSNLTLYSYEEAGAVRLLHLPPNLSSLGICSLHSHEHHLELLTHTNMQSLFVTAGLAYRHRISAHQRLRDPMATFLNALTLPDLHVLNVGTKSWTGEELKGVGSGTVGMAIDIGTFGIARLL